MDDVINNFSQLEAGTAFLVTISLIITDGLHALYTDAVTKRHDALAATYGAAIYLFSAFVVIYYTENPAYITFVFIGSWIGTYSALKIANWKESREGK